MSDHDTRQFLDRLETRDTNRINDILPDLLDGLGKGQMLELLYTAIDSAHEMVVITDARNRIGDEKIIYVNNSMERVTGYTKEELIGENPKIFQGPDTDKETIQRLRKKLSQGKHFEGETFNYRKDGSMYRVRWSIDPIRDEQGEITHFVSVQQDVTDQWRQKKKLEDMVKERELLLKEIHHRVKNNLAVIAGLLQLQSDKTNSEETRHILSESINRIQSIATLHEKLYKTDDFNNIFLPDYFKDLLEQLINSMEQNEMNIATNTDIAKITIPVSKAVPLSLIFNELVTNSIKHGFEEQDEGTIRISVDQTNDIVTMRVSDNGIGFPDDLEIEKLQSLGLRLIDTLCKQLQGEYEFENRNPGTGFILRFKLDQMDTVYNRT